MPDLIPIIPQSIGDKTLPAVSARELHEKLGIKKPFTQWLEQYTGKDDWRKNCDFSVFNLEVKNPEGGGRPGIDAALSIQMAEHIAMMTRTSKGREVREYFRQARDERDARIVPTRNSPTTTAQMFALQAQVNLEHEQRLELVEAKMQTILDRQPPAGKLRPGDWLRRFSKPHLSPDLMKSLNAHCRSLEKAEYWRPDSYDWMVPYHSPEVIAQAYEEVTRQLSFIHDPGVGYARQRRMNA